MENLFDPEELIICPYNSSHHIRRMKMGFHLVKCKKNYPDAKLVTCDFNITHRIPEPELQYHHQHCTSRKDMEIPLYRAPGENTNKFPVLKVHVETEESWDNSDSASYDPKAYCERNAVLRKLDVESAAKKKNFHIDERFRFTKMANNKSKGDIIDKNQVGADRCRKERVIVQETSIDDPTKSEFSPNSISVLLERVKVGANTPFNSFDKDE